MLVERSLDELKGCIEQLKALGQEIEDTKSKTAAEALNNARAFLEASRQALKLAETIKMELVPLLPLTQSSEESSSDDP